MYRAFRRVPAPRIKSEQNPPFITFPAAVAGISSAKSIGRNAKLYAQVIDNGYSTETGVKPRAGKRRHATTGTRAVKSFMVWQSGILKKMFACGDGKIFDVTQPASPTIPVAPSVSGLTGNDWVGANMANAGGEFLVAVNGADTHRVYDGSSWATNVPAITGVSSALLSFVWKYADRLFFIEKGTLKVWYLGVDSPGGAATQFDLRGVFQKGGFLVYGATWSADTGGGLGQRWVVVTSEGEAAVYEGTDPSAAATWRKVGVYDVSPPLGKNSWNNIGGDLVMLNRSGMVPFSQSVNKDPAALSLSSITKEVGPHWKLEMTRNASKNWQFVKYPDKQLGYVFYANSFTSGDTSDVLDVLPSSYTVNLSTGAWSTYSGWDMQCAVLFNNIVYFGSSSGRVYQAEFGGNDDGAAYVFKYLDWPSEGGKTKTFLQCRTTFTYSVIFNLQLTASTDYNIKWPVAPNAALDDPNAVVWDGPGATWDSGARWDQTGVMKTEKRWRSIGRTGFRVAPMIQMTFSNLIAPDCELVASEMTYREGALVV